MAAHTEAAQVFEAAADGYDQLRRQLIPCFDGFYGMAVDLLRFDREAPLRVLDVGAGTGLLAEAVARRFPNARVELLDASEAMLARARQRLAAGGERIGFRVADYRTAPLGGPWDAIVSALSIHHLQDAEKRALYAAAGAALAPGGALVNADNVQAEDPAVQALHRQAWIDAIRATGSGEQELGAALERTRVDVLAPLAPQLDWLREAGLERVGCYYAWHHFAVFAGYRPGHR
ncbi:MAG: class I SAM-dependent methyltransferase [Anaeromyxobacter sp.]